MSQCKVYLQLCQSWIHPLGPGVSPPVTWSTLGRQANEEAHVGNFGRYRCQMDIFVEIVAIKGSVWLERHLWLSSYSNLRNSIRRSQKKTLFQVYWETQGHKCARYWDRRNILSFFFVVADFNLSLCRPLFFSVSLVSMAGNLGTDYSQLCMFLSGQPERCFFFLILKIPGQ